MIRLFDKERERGRWSKYKLKSTFGYESFVKASPG